MMASRATTYVVVTGRVQVDGVYCAVGETVELSDARAAKLLTAGMIAVVLAPEPQKGKGRAATPATTEPTAPALEALDAEDADTADE